MLVKSAFLGFPTNLFFGPPARVGWGGVEKRSVVCVLVLVTCNTLVMQCCYRFSCNLQHALDATLLPLFLPLATDGATCYPKMSEELKTFCMKV